MSGKRPEIQIMSAAPGAALSGPLAGGRLVFAAGVAGVSIDGDPALADLCQARFEPPGSELDAPDVRVQGRTVTIEDSRLAPTGSRGCSPIKTARVTLNGALPWEIEFRGGVSRLTADLRPLTLRALDLRSVSEGVILLPRPAGVSFIYFAGSASDVAIRCPDECAVRLLIGGSASRLTFGGQCVYAAAEGTCWESAGYDRAAGRYDISIAGSASNLTIGIGFGRESE
jgi:hypothetical protein